MSNKFAVMLVPHSLREKDGLSIRSDTPLPIFRDGDVIDVKAFVSDVEELD